MTDLAKLVIAVDSQQTKRATEDLDALANGARRTEKATESLTKVTARMRAEMAQARQSTNEFAAVMGKLGIGAGIAGVVGVTAALKGMAVALKDAQVSADRMNTIFKTTTGSAAGAAREMAYVTEIAKKMSVDLAGAGEGYAKISAAARGTAMQGEQARKIFEAAATAAAAMGADAFKTTQIMRAFEQMISKGNISLEEIRLQLGEVMPGAMQVAARAMGTTTQGLYDMLAAGLEASDFLPMFADQIKRELGGAAADAATKLQGSINQLNTSWVLLKREMAAGVSDGAAGAMNELARLLEIVRSRMQALRETGKSLPELFRAAGVTFDDFISGKKEAVEATKKGLSEFPDILREMLKTATGLQLLPTLWGKITGEIDLATESQKRNKKAAEEMTEAHIQAAEQIANAAMKYRTGMMNLQDEIKKGTLEGRQSLEISEAANKFADQIGTPEWMVFQNQMFKRHEEEREAERRKARRGIKEHNDAVKKLYDEAQSNLESAGNAEARALRTKVSKLESEQQQGLISEQEAIEQRFKLEQEALNKRIEIQKKAVDLAKKSGDAKSRREENDEMAELIAERLEMENRFKGDMAQARKKFLDDTRQTLEQEYEAVRSQVDALTRENENLGMSEAQINDVTAARYEHAAAMVEEQKAMLAKEPGNEMEIKVLEQQIEWLNRVAEARRELAKQQTVSDQNEDMVQQAKDVAKEWENTSKKVEDWLVEAFSNGTDHANGMFKKLVADLKAMFARLILQPIIAPIMGAIGGAMGGIFGGGEMGGTLGAGGTGTGGIGSLLQSARSIYNSGGLAGAAGGLFQKAGVRFGSQGLAHFGNGMVQAPSTFVGAQWAPGAVGYGQMAGYAINSLGGIGAGLMAGRAISGGYGRQSTVNAGTAIGAAAGSFIPGVGTAIGAAVGGVVGGFLNRMFGRGPKKYTTSGLNANYDSATGMTEGETFNNWKKKGGWFRSDKKGSEKTPIDPALARDLSQQFKVMKEATTELAKSVGANASILDGHTTSISLSFKRTGDAAKDQAEFQRLLGEAMGKVADDMAKDVIPNIMDFAKGAETASQVLARLGETFAGTDAAMKMLDKDVTTVFGAVGMASADARQGLVDLAGGMDELLALTTYFHDNYFTSAEKAALAEKQLGEQAEKLGLSSNMTKEQIKLLVQQQDASTEQGRSMMVHLLQLAQTHDQLAKAQEALRAEMEAMRQAALQTQAALHIMGSTLTEVPDAARRAGGGDQFGANLQQYIAEFEGEAAAAATQVATLNAELTRLGQPMVQTAEEFKALVQKAQQGMEQGQYGADALYGSLIKLGAGFGAALNSLEDLQKAAVDGLRDAERGVQQAKKSVSDAWRSVADAQQRIGDIHKQYAEQKADMERQVEERHRQQQRQKLQEHIAATRRSEDQARTISRRNEDRYHQDKLRMEDRARAVSLKLEERRYSDRLRMEDRAHAISLKNEDRNRQDALRREDRARSVSLRNEDRYRQDMLRREDRARALSLRLEDRYRQDKLRLEDRARVLSLRNEDRAIEEKRRLEDKARAAWMKAMQKTYEAAQKKLQEADQKLNGARSTLTEAYNRESSALKKTIDTMKQFGKTMRSFREDLLAGDLSPLTPEQKYAQLTGRMNDTVARARAGDEDAQAQVQQVVSQWLEASRTLYASSDAYQQDFQKAQDLLKELQLSAEASATQTEQQLEALKKLAESALPELIEKTISVEQAIQQFKQAQLEADTAKFEVERIEREIEAAREQEEHIAEMRQREDIAKEDRRLREEWRIEDKRLAQERALEDRRLRQEMAIEDRRLAKERALEDRRMRQEWALEDRRLAQERALEDRRMRREWALEDRRIADERAREDRRQRQEWALEDRRLAKERAIEDRRFYADLELENRRLQQDQHLQQMWQDEDNAREAAELARQRAAMQEQYYRDIANAERSLRDTVLAAHSAEADLLRAQDTLANAEQRHREVLRALDAIRMTAASSNVAPPSTGRYAVYPGFATGYRDVPHDMTVRLHEGERVLTAAQTIAHDALLAAGNKTHSAGQAGQGALLAALNRLTEVVLNMKQENREDAMNMIRAAFDAADRTADKVTAGVRDTSERSAFRERIKPILG